MIIEDGLGKNGNVRVSDENRLATESKSRPSEEVEAAHGRAYVLHGICQTAAAAEGGLLAFTNTSTSEELVITRVYIDPWTLTDANLIIKQEKIPTVTAGTDITKTGIVNKNFGSGLSVTGTLKISDASSDMTFSGGTVFHAIPLISRTPINRDLKGTNVVTPKTTIGWSFALEDGSAAVDDQIISFTVNCYTRTIGAELP